MSITRRRLITIAAWNGVDLALPRVLRAQGGNALPVVEDVELQPLSAQVRRLLEALEYLGAPLAAADQEALRGAFTSTDAGRAVERIQNVLDRYCLAGVEVNAEMRVKVVRGEAAARLVEGGWRLFLVKVHNVSGTTASLRCVSPQAQSVFSFVYPPPESDAGRQKYSNGLDRRNVSDRQYARATNSAALSEAERWLDLEMFDGRPLNDTLDGSAVEYRVLQLYSRDAGRREASLAFDVGQGTQDIGFRNDLAVLFECLPARVIRLRVRERGAPVMASFVIRDAQGRVYPSQAKRLAPDFAFHLQVYRADGETLKLPVGTYHVEVRRGPESIVTTHELLVARGENGSAVQEAAF